MRRTQKVAIGYVRVSTERQATEGVSLEAQEARLRSWAAAQGLEVAAIHVDAGLSGARADNRPALQAALTEACKRRGVLVSYSLSRIARSTRDAIDIADRLERAGADLVSLSESIDTTSASGKLFFRLMAAMAEFERDIISERTTAALGHKRMQNLRISGRIPYGYALGEDGHLVELEEEQETIRTALALRREGRSLRSIGAELEAQGRRRQNGAASWPSNVILAILNRRAKLSAAA